MAHGHRLRPSARHVRDRAVRRLDDAIDAIDAIEVLGRGGNPDPDAVAEAIHEMRVRCKEVRALLRLVQPADSGARARVDRWVAEAGSSLGTTRDAQVLAETLAGLSVTVAEAMTPPAGHDPDSGAVERAARLLRDARHEVDRWRVGRRATPVVDGVAAGYRLAHRRFTAVRNAPSDDPHDQRMHEWRKAVKRLTYQVRAVRRWAPTMLPPYADRLDDLGALLGLDHDLANAVARLEQEDAAEGTAVAAAIEVATARQSAVRIEALRLGASLFAETPPAFRRRLRAYVRSAGGVRR